MTSLVLAQEFGTTNACEGVSLLGIPTERSAKRQLSGSADEVVKTISTIVDEMILDVISKRTAEEFASAFHAAFPRYVTLVMSFCKIAATIVPEPVLARVSAESFSELEADIRDQAVDCFGSDIRDRAVFTVWTLRKISARLEVLVKSKELTSGDQQKDHQFATEFLFHALRARFNIDCLRASMRTRQSIYPEVLPVIDDGLRSAVNAYAWIKQAVDLRSPTDEMIDIATEFTTDDQALLDASMADLAADEQKLSGDDTW